MNENDTSAAENSPISPSRREFLRRGGSGLLAVQVGGVMQWLTPRQAQAENSPLKVLNSSERTALEALGDTLLPGAAEAGLAHFVDHHLAVPVADCLLLLRYLDVPPPFSTFYQSGLAALDHAAMAQHIKTFAQLAAEQRNDLVGVMSRENPPDWSGPPAPFFYYVTRSDAVDVVYGTEEGFARLNVPYLAHIRPPTRW